MDSDSQPQKFFAGEFRHAIDEKNRITVPSDWRRAMAGPRFHHPARAALSVSPGHVGGGICPHERASRIGRHGPRARTPELLAAIAFARKHGASDRQGRLVLPEDHCKELGLKGEVALVGGSGRFEIWNLQKWKRAQEEETPTYQHVANVIGL